MKWTEKLGIPSSIAWGYLGILIFMMGDGLEIGWLSPWLIDQGFTVQQTSLLFSAYGVTVAVSSWLSGVLVEALGTKRTMWLGVLFYILGTIGFLSFGLPNFNIWWMVPFYALRGLGYPLFAYSFLVWIAYRADQERLGTAVGWFWFVFTGGLNVLGAYYSVVAIKLFGHYTTLWSSIFWVVLGAIIALIINKDKLEPKQGSSAKEKLYELIKGVTIVKEEPKVLLGGIVRVINTTAQFAFPVFCLLILLDTEFQHLHGWLFGGQFLQAIFYLIYFLDI